MSRLQGTSFRDLSHSSGISPVGRYFSGLPDHYLILTLLCYDEVYGDDL